jgi:PAS domain S-box-containing protein
MSTVRLRGPVQVVRPKFARFFDLIRSFPDQARLALGTRGVAWATAAGVVGLACCAISMAAVALSLHATEASYTRHKTSELLALDQSTRRLMYGIHLMTYDQVQPVEAAASLRKAWAQFEAALTAACGRASGAPPYGDRQHAICDDASAIHDLLAGEIKAFAPPDRLLDRATLGRVIVQLGRLNAASAADAGSVDALIGKLVDDYGIALLVLTLSTAGFVSAGLVLILLVGHASMEHQRQWKAAGEARDLLQETIDSLPAGVVVYDHNERLEMFNAAAVASTPLLKRPGIIGISYEELARETVKLSQEFGAPLENTAEEWIARFRSKGTRIMRQVVGDRWFEWSEKLTPSGRTVGLRVDVTDLKKREMEIEHARDLLQETIDALPAGVVLYDRDERLVMFNKAAAAIAPHIAEAGAIGKTYSQMAYESERELDARGVVRTEGAKEWIARFRSKGIRHLRPAPGGRWIEWLERSTSSGGTVGLRVDVTDLKNKELEIESARADYQSLVDSLSDMVYALDPKGVFTFASAAAVDLLEVPAAGVVGKRFADFLEAEDLERATAAARAHLRSTDEAVRHINLRVKRADGSIRHMECRYRRPPGGRGQAVAAVGVMRDVTERVELTARLERQMAEVEHARAEYQALLDSLSDVVVKVDPRTTRIVFANAAAADQWGIQLVGADAFEHVADEDKDRVVAAIRSGLAGRKPQLLKLQYRIVTGSGETRHVETHYRKMWDPDGKSLVVGIVRDIEDRVRLERRLAEEMGYLRSIVESIGAGVMLTDRDLRVIVVNREVLNIHGVTEQDLLGRPVTETVGTALDMKVHRQWLAGEHRDPVKYTRSMVDASGRQRLFNLTASPIVDSSGMVRQIVFLGVDDTERRETEQALFAAERLTTVGEMAATVAHELSQPLQVIDLACHTARDELSEAAERGSAADPEFMATKLGRIAHQVERATRIIGDLRAFVRGAGAGDDPVPFQIAEAVQGAVDLTTHGLGQQATLSASLPDNLPAVIGHVGRLEQVLVNLINNARDAGGRTISVAASAVEREGQPLVRIAVEDSGPGIAPGVLSRLFVAFVTTKARGKGTGLGLRICRRIVEEMDGSISASNRAEGGACFEILLPAAEQTDAP